MGTQRENAADGRCEDAARGHRESERWHDVERMANPERSLFEAPNPALEGVHRGSPLSLVTGAVSGLGVALGVSLVAIVRVIGGNVVEELPGIVAGAVLLIAASVVGAVVTWRTRTWELTDAGIMLCSGLVNARRLQVPYEHIHTVNMSSSLMERVLGIMTLDLDTGAADTEGQVTSIKGLQAGVAEALREELFRRKAAALAGQDFAPAVEGMFARQATGDSPVDPAPACDASDKAPDACVTLAPARLVLAALTETRVIAQAAGFLILIVQGINFLQESRLVNLSEAAGDIVALPIALLVAAAGLLLALSLIIGFAISFAISLISFAGYRAERRGGRITVERGLLGRTSHAVASERIQPVSPHPTGTGAPTLGLCGGAGVGGGEHRLIGRIVDDGRHGPAPVHSSVRARRVSGGHRPRICRGAAHVGFGAASAGGGTAAGAPHERKDRAPCRGACGLVRACGRRSAARGVVDHSAPGAYRVVRRGGRRDRFAHGDGSRAPVSRQPHRARPHAPRDAPVCSM